MSLLSTPFWSGRWRAARSHWDKTVEYLRVRSVMSLLSTPFWSGRWRAARSHWDKTVEYLRVRSVARGLLGAPGILGAPLSQRLLRKGVDIEIAGVPPSGASTTARGERRTFHHLKLRPAAPHHSAFRDRCR